MPRDLLVSLRSLFQRNRALISTTLSASLPFFFAQLLLRHLCHLLRVWHRCTRWDHCPERLVRHWRPHLHVSSSSSSSGTHDFVVRRCHWHERLVLTACDRHWRWRCRESGEPDSIQCTTQAEVRVQVLFNGGVVQVRCVSVVWSVACSRTGLVRAWCSGVDNSSRRNARTLNLKP